MNKYLPEAIEEASKVFLPEREHYGDLPRLILEKLTVPIVPHPYCPYPAKDGRPYFDIVSSKFKIDPLSPAWNENRFNEVKEEMVSGIANFINDLKSFDSYPIVYTPEVKYGVAYIDWRGADYPFDVRVIMGLNQGEFAIFMAVLVARHVGD